ncbi:RidA family protein [Roseiarcaceae bacterium H3SJ34-1]|uniref:RidA family protein n=1 Tax=Terripilifer ovatus TaxID=3032367 RepID=UPI003AB9B4AA|nr:RidA family protein [Roseiarcaceae bacterium H3SJ34-1]
MPKFFNPPTVAKPSSNFSHGVTVPAGARRLIMSGQVGMRLDGTICEGIEAQTEQVFDNILALIDAAGMKKTDLVKIVTYCISPDHLAKVREVRSRKLGDHAPASTLLIISALANPKFLIEVEAEAVSEG